MEKFIEFTGGARVDFINSTYPMAKLKIYREKLEIHNGFKLYTMDKSAVKNISIIKWFPIIAQGIKVNYIKDGANNDIIFWYLFNLKKLDMTLKKFNWL